MFPPNALANELMALQRLLPSVIIECSFQYLKSFGSMPTSAIHLPCNQTQGTKYLKVMSTSLLLTLLHDLLRDIQGIHSSTRSCIRFQLDWPYLFCPLPVCTATFPDLGAPEEEEELLLLLLLLLCLQLQVEEEEEEEEEEEMDFLLDSCGTRGTKATCDCPFPTRR